MDVLRTLVAGMIQIRFGLLREDTLLAKQGSMVAPESNILRLEIDKTAQMQRRHLVESLSFLPPLHLDRNAIIAVAAQTQS